MNLLNSRAGEFMPQTSDRRHAVSASQPNQIKGSPKPRPRIGVIAGSGPEAGIDLWSKILTANREALAGRFTGDVDSPAVVIFSEPALGLSMDLPANDEVVWQCLEKAVREIAPHVDVFTIACNTLHYYADRVRKICGQAIFLGVADVVRAHIEEQQPDGRVALMGAASVAALDKWSPYSGLHREVLFETPVDLRNLHDLIHDIKLAGGETPDVRRRFVETVAKLAAPTVFLACTELPLVRASVPGKVLVDINKLLAEHLVSYSLGEVFRP
jgi:aspartate racemase